jgi:hypothetical protein
MKTVDMTAKELKVDLIRSLYQVYVKEDSTEYYVLDEKWKAFENQLCKEQRETCANIVYNSEADDKVYEWVKDASMPEL